MCYKIALRQTEKSIVYLELAEEEKNIEAEKWTAEQYTCSL